MRAWNWALVVWSVVADGCAVVADPRQEDIFHSKQDMLPVGSSRQKMIAKWSPCACGASNYGKSTIGWSGNGKRAQTDSLVDASTRPVCVALAVAEAVWLPWTASGKTAAAALIPAAVPGDVCGCLPARGADRVFGPCPDRCAVVPNHVRSLGGHPWPDERVQGSGPDLSAGSGFSLVGCSLSGKNAVACGRAAVKVGMVGGGYGI